MIEEVHYVRHPDIPAFEAQGWVIVQTLARTHHGEHAVLMRRDVETGPQRPVHGETGGK